jgi:hypothetical protein
MVIQESREILQLCAISIFSAVGISILTTGVLSTGILPAGILPAGITIPQVFVAGVVIGIFHELVGVLAYLALHARVILKVRFEFRIALQELRVVHQGWSFAKFLAKFGFAVEKLIESRQIPARDVIGLAALAVLALGSLLISLLILRGRRLRMH